MTASTKRTSIGFAMLLLPIKRAIHHLRMFCASDWRRGLRDACRPARSGLLLFALLLATTQVRAESVKILVQDSPLAGSQYYYANALWSQLTLGASLTLVREPDNRYDRRAVRVEWNGHPLGYLPRAENRSVAAALDRGERLEARITALRETTDPWQRIAFAVYLVL
ncbi:HIRAN domain-containing protein [Rhodocyclus gracilis]|uniref:HIRAN domain-containing protein n=1 Tax=Rhodocyclus gracilis TaxID=2929842 RepID=UPI001F5FACC4|nr:HIRAN domain-containing protein [Rhodocyclus gracilis]